MNKIVSFEAYEDIYYSIFNFNFGEYDYKTCEQLIKSGGHKFVMCGGMTLTLVPFDYELKMFEFSIYDS